MELNEEQIKFLKEYTSGAWTLNSKTGLVDIDGDFDFTREGYPYLLLREGGLKDFKGVRFGGVTGHFKCKYNSLTSLEGAPQEVGGDFDCSCNKLTSLEGAPQKVGGNFDCSGNNLTSLKGAPKMIKGYLDCHANNLTSLGGAPPKKVSDKISCYNNTISEKTLKLVWNTMQEKKIDYWTALCILKSEISKSDFEKLEGELDKRLSQDAQKGYSTLDQFGFFE